MEAMTPPDFNDFMPLTPSSLGVESAACRRLQATMLNDLLWNIYFSTFEIRYAIWLGDSCCPFLEMTPVSLLLACQKAFALALKRFRRSLEHP